MVQGQVVFLLSAVNNQTVSAKRSFWKCQWSFFDISILHTLPCKFANRRAGSQLKMSERQTKAGNQDFCKTCTLSFTHSGLAEQLLFSSLCSKVTLTFSHSHSFSLSHFFNLSFNHSRHAEQLLFSSVCFWFPKWHVVAWKTKLKISIWMFQYHQ